MSSVYTVAQVNQYIRNMFAQDILLTRLYVKGEVSNCKYHSSGHLYFSLKDESGVLRCVMFASDRRGLNFRLENGQMVIAFGQVGTYPRDGAYQLYAREIRQDGLGVLYERFQALKTELEQMGIFSPEYKQPIPDDVRRLGIVTAPTGAAVRDMIQIARRRHPGIEIILYPAKVQGEGAKESIVRGLQVLDQAGVDVIIIGRGGGSIEDLWAFNEECVARAVFACKTPVISAVGHETDTVISDFVADLRAPTPSAAAELAVPDMQQVLRRIREKRDRLSSVMQQRLSFERMHLEKSRAKLAVFNPRRTLTEMRHTHADLQEKLRRAMLLQTQQAKREAALRTERLNERSPLRHLTHGYAYVSSFTGERISRIKDAAEGERWRVFFRDGYAETKVEKLIAESLEEET